MERDRCEVNWIVEGAGGDPVPGAVRWDPVHSLWNGSMLVAAVVLGPLTATPASIVGGLSLTALFLLLGHSVGFHRLLIHGSFRTIKSMHRFLIWC